MYVLIGPFCCCPLFSSLRSCSAFSSRSSYELKRNQIISISHYFQTYSTVVFAQNLNEVGNGKICDLMLPSQLQDHVRLQEVIAFVQHCSEAIIKSFAKEKLHQIFNNFWLTTLCCIFDSVLKIAQIYKRSTSVNYGELLITL